MKKAILFILTLTATLFLSAAPLTFTKAPWTIQIDSATGAMVSLEWLGLSVCTNTADMNLFNWGPKWNAGTKDAPILLVSHEWNEKQGQLILHTKVNDYKIDIFIQLGLDTDADVISFTPELTYCPQDKSAPPEKFVYFACNFPIDSDGRYMIPWDREFLTGPKTGLIRDLAPGSDYRTPWGVPPFIVEKTDSFSLVFLPECRQDYAHTNINVSANGNVCIHENSGATGWAYPNKTQHLSSFYIGACAKNLEEAFHKRVWQIYDAIGMNVLNDTPEWFRDAIMYSFGAGGTCGSNLSDLGGFEAARTELLPRIEKLGFSCIWMLPVEDGNGNRIYWPRDYYKLNETQGTESELKSLVSDIHQAGMHVLLDIVPHGGTPNNAMMRGSTPWQLAYKEDGTPDSYWCYDFGDPDWQKYIADVVRHYMKTFNTDGVRIDAIAGSNYMNWRREDFPSLENCPPNVNKEWWRKSLESNGGKMPPLAYERGSLARRQAGLEMLKAIHNAVNETKESGAVLGEADIAPYMIGADCIFNFSLPLTLCETATWMSPPKWTECLARWLDESVFTFPKGTRWLQYFGSHDQLSPYNFVGFGTARSLIGFAMMMEGIPMVYHDQDIGIGVFLRHMIEIRKRLPEFRRGSARYASPAPNVLSVARRYDSLVSIGFANLGPDKAQIVPCTLLSADILNDNTLYNAWIPGHTAPIATGMPGDMQNLEISVNPFDCCVISFRPNGAPSPFAELNETPSSLTHHDSDITGIEFTEHPDVYKIQTSCYRMLVSRSDGIIQEFSDASGKQLLHGAGIIIDESPSLLQFPLKRDVGINTKIEQECVRIIQDTATYSGSQIRLTYTCRADRVTIEGTMYHPEHTPKAAFALAGNEIDRWQVSSAEGLIDDFFCIRHQNGIIGSEGAEGKLYYRPSGTPVIWQAATNPLSFITPVITAFSQNHGIELSFNDLLQSPPANIAVLDKLNKKNGWHAAIFWKDITPYPWQDTPTETRTFSFDLRPIPAPLPPPETTSWSKIGGVRLRNISQGWEIENGEYHLLINKCGGVIRSLANRSGRMIMKNCQILTDRGFRQRYGSKNLLMSSGNDGETGVSIREIDGRLHMKFEFTMRLSRRRTLIEPPIWGSIEYIFDDSPTIEMTWNALTEGVPKDDIACIGLELQSPDSFQIYPIVTDALPDATTNWDIRNNANLPKEIQVLDESRLLVLSIADILYPDNSALSCVKRKGNALRISAFDGEAALVAPMQTYRSSLKLTIEN